KCARNLSRGRRVLSGDHTGPDRLLKDLKHDSAVRSRVGKVEALIDHRKIRNDIRLNSLHQGRPVIHGWILDFAALQAIVSPRPQPMNYFAAPALHRANGATARPYRLARRAVFALQVLFQGAPDNAYRHSYFVDPDLHAMPHVAGLINRRAKWEVQISGVR